MSDYTQRLEEILSMRYEDWPEEFEAIEQLIREEINKERLLWAAREANKEQRKVAGLPPKQEARGK